ncbi:septation ring formation regulator EzrA [Caldibacillus debilis]|jgi:septation ring formation regulator|uniref:Septation ring formation regulator EzrA n=1 Tax=Caldibacillus debilis GB1 TaxID=1339248 RepID=A0A420VG28_9BACI|nr:septation ring formation regulator EzrA [Caldibacillus debilis]RKO62599.1 Negative regulator of septation ring formation [Caldibacillus debilis GB1]
MEYVIGIVLIAAVLILIGFFVKRNYYQEIDRLEAWKIEIMNRPVLDEIAKIKQLKMHGQAEEYFEQWRKTWDNIVTGDLPDVEEWLYDAEDCVSKYRFSKAKEVLAKIERTLKSTEEKMESMLAELNELIGSEKKNREDIARLEQLYKKLKKELLANRHSFGKAAARLEGELEAAGHLFARFEEETDQGNYLNAREIVLELKEKLERLDENMKKIPLLLEECLHVIPGQIKEIVDGSAEMRKQGYNLEHLGLEKEIRRIEDQISRYREYLEQAETEEVSKGLEDAKESLNLLYDLLEKEVSSKLFVQQNKEKIRQEMDTIKSVNDRLQEEVRSVQISYQLPEKETEFVAEMDKKIEQMKKTLSLLLTPNGTENTAYSILKEKLEEISEEMKQLEEKQKEYLEKLQSLRKDELEARQRIQELKNKVVESRLMINRSAIPGVPQDIEALLYSSFEAVQECLRHLEQKPLSMEAVRASLAKAEENVTYMHDKVEEMLENAFLVEKIIQYGNRYRTRYPFVREKLLEAEKAFRSYDYVAALEQAAAAVEKVEPGALKKIEALLNEQSQ